MTNSLKAIFKCKQVPFTSIRRSSKL